MGHRIFGTSVAFVHPLYLTKVEKKGRTQGVICGVRVQEIDDPLMRKIRYLDKLVDELARGNAMEKILRTA